MTQPTSDTRLIERWLPIAEIGIESLRERTPMTPFPAPNRLHVWWARRDALTKGLMHAGFTITASWPINTEAEGSLHIKDKAAANSTIFLVCRPRAVLPSDAETRYWEDVEPLVAGAVRERVAEFQAADIRGVDLYLACFGPALEEFSKHWPLKRGTPNSLPPSHKRTQKELFPDEWDPYAVSPEDALNAARREVKSWRLEQLTHKRARTELDPRTSWFVLAWDAFQAPVFPYDEALAARPCRRR